MNEVIKLLRNTNRKNTRIKYDEPVFRMELSDKSPELDVCIYADAVFAKFSIGKRVTPLFRLEPVEGYPNPRRRRFL